MSVTAGVFCIFFVAIEAARVVTHSSKYDQYSGVGCFINQGAKPVDPQGDPATVGFFTNEQCAEKCDNLLECKAYTRGASGSVPSLCWLRKNVEIGRCLKDVPYETWAKKEVVEDDKWDCQLHTQLNCQNDVQWAHNKGKIEKWAKYAYQFMPDIAGVSIEQASVEDFHRLSFCKQTMSSQGKTNIQHNPCRKAPCACSNPPCDTCATVGKAKIQTTTTTTTTTKAPKKTTTTKKIRTKAPKKIRTTTKAPKKCASVYDSENVVCKPHVAWAHGEGKKQMKYPKLQTIAGVSSASATVDDFHRLWFCSKRKDRCTLPPCACTNKPCDSCKEKKNNVPKPPSSPSSRGGGKSGKNNARIGWKAGGKFAGHWGWCKQQAPVPHWTTTVGCHGSKNLDVNVLTYNLFWWFLFGVRKGADRMAGKLVAKKAPWDLMGFQECDDVKRIVADSGMLHTHDFYRGTHAVSNAWDKHSWHPIKNGHTEVAEDHRSQWYGRRAVVWSRLQHKRTGKIVFFMNFHGPLPVGGDGGGFCGAEASAYNILKVIGDNARQGDCVIMVGDCNAVRNSKFLNTLGKHLTHQYQGRSFGGVDNFYTNGCAQLVSSRNLGNGGSDHDALGATFKI